MKTANRIIEIRFGTLCVWFMIKTIDGNYLRSNTILPSGWDIIEATLEFLKTEHHLLTNRLVAANLITQIGSAIEPVAIEVGQVGGRNLLTGYPDRIDVSPKELFDKLEPLIIELLGKIVMRIEAEIELLLDDDEILDNTVHLTGDFLLLRQFDVVMETVIRDMVLPDAVVVEIKS